MRRRFNPWVVVLTAALTFGSLMAFVGPRLDGHGRFGHYGRHGFMHHGYAHGYDGYRDCDGPRRSDNWRDDSRRDDFHQNSPHPEGRLPELRGAEPNQTDSL